VPKVEREVKLLNKVAKLRRYTGLTQSDVAELFGISLQAYSRKEREITPFTDKEKVILKELFSDDFPDITVGEIFFDE